MATLSDYFGKDIWYLTLIVGVLMACIPFGLFMTFYMDDASWLWFCAPLIVFLS